MSAIVRAGRQAGVLEIIYRGVLTTQVRHDAIRRGWDLMGTKSIPVAIVDFSEAEWAIRENESRDFQTLLANVEHVDYSLVIYVASPELRDRLDQEAAVGNDLGRIIEVVDDIEEAYTLISENDGSEF